MAGTGTDRDSRADHFSIFLQPRSSLLLGRGARESGALANNNCNHLQHLQQLHLPKSKHDTIVNTMANQKPCVLSFIFAGDRFT